MHSELRERAALVALLQQPGARWHEVALDVLDAESAVDVLERRPGMQDTLFPETQAVESAIETAARQLAEWADGGIGVHAFFDHDYPAQLRGIHEMPPVLFTRGRLHDDHRAIAVVGTRQATAQGLKIATAVASALARDRITVVSGLAKGAERPGVHVVHGVDEILRVTNDVIAELNTGPDALPEAPNLAWA
jgi:DNA processing protein